MRKKELLTRIEALERKLAQQADLIEQWEKSLMGTPVMSKP